jgi:hypothetical protein
MDGFLGLHAGVIERHSHAAMKNLERRAIPVFLRQKD